MKDISSIIEVLKDRIDSEEIILGFSSSNQCLEYHTGYLNALKDILKEVNSEKD